MAKRVELDESMMDSAERKTPRKQRRIFVKKPSFFLFKKISEDGDLSPIGSCQTESEIREAYEKALDGGISQDEIRGFKGRVLEFKVKETKRRIRVT